MEKIKANMDDVKRSRACQDWGRMEVGRGLYFLGAISWVHGGSARLDVLVGLKPRGSWVEQIRVNGEVDLWGMRGSYNGPMSC